ncbi:MAG: hypothetical protein ACRCYO_15320, partial [Bacteroidia bacterium]
MKLSQLVRRNTAPLLLVRLFLFWMVLFAFTRLIFLLWNREEIGATSFGETLGVFWHSLYIDLATSTYFCAFPFLVWAVAGFSPKPIFSRINLWLVGLLIFLIAAITFSELPIYDEWHHKLTYKAIWYLRNP